MSLSDLPTGTVSEPTSRTYPDRASTRRPRRLPRSDGGFDVRRPPQSSRGDASGSNGRLPSGATADRQQLEALRARIRQLEAEVEHLESERQAVIDHYEELLREQRTRSDENRGRRRRDEHPIRRLLGL
ncbi:hypothetical protein [Haloprofundus sp. MHR1]|uniref:hypothetical protein n=1 Tax=Haloprofundus sp. MHR1 TaxID=2572921 RepID=UPI0010BE7440|nr:hypothetical protein [Haloprofundus sp. MHR1]QCJ46792.1 hypothetical protein FCF25_06570 [Haloprofundus sp. MHR1]